MYVTVTLAIVMDSTFQVVQQGAHIVVLTGLVWSKNEA